MNLHQCLNVTVQNFELLWHGDMMEGGLGKQQVDGHKRVHPSNGHVCKRLNAVSENFIHTKLQDELILK